MLAELIVGGYLPQLERLGVVRSFQWDAVTGPSGVPLPLKAGYTVNPAALVFLGAFVIFLYVLYRSRLRLRFPK
jgi:hypothetical protein